MKRKDKSEVFSNFIKKAIQLTGNAFVTKQDAVTHRLMFYYNPCVKCGGEYRYTSCGDCRNCKIEKNYYNNKKVSKTEQNKQKEVKKKIDSLKHELEFNKIFKEYDF